MGGDGAASVSLAFGRELAAMHFVFCPKRLSACVRGGPQRDRIHSFYGRMDELAVFGRALTADNIRRLFEAGSGKGARSTIDFREGHFETPKSQYVAGGSHVVKIDGFKYVEDSEEDGTAESVRLFPIWSSRVELPATGGTFDFDIPASAARR